MSVLNGYYQPAETIDMQVTVTNINTLKGSVKLSFFNNPKTYLKRGKEYKTFSQNATSESMTFYVKGIKKGDYAIAIYQDVNSDNKCNLNIVGKPVEPYGFSNNFKLKFAKPSFEELKITANKDMSITISLIEK